MADINFVGANGKPDVFLGDHKGASSSMEDASSPATPHHAVPLTDAEEKVLAKAYLKLDMFFLTTITTIYWLNFLGEHVQTSDNEFLTYLSSWPSQTEQILEMQEQRVSSPDHHNFVAKAIPVYGEWLFYLFCAILPLSS